MSIVGKTWTEGTPGFSLPDACLVSNEAWGKVKELAKAALALAGLGTPKPFEIAYAVNPGKTDWVLHDADHGPAKEDGIFFHKDMIAIKQGEKTMYYGDWEIVVSQRS